MSALDVIADPALPAPRTARSPAMPDVPLGSMTYHFTSIDDLLGEAFQALCRQIADGFEAPAGLGG